MKTEKKERRETKEASGGKVPAQCSCTLWTTLLVAGYLHMMDDGPDKRRQLSSGKCCQHGLLQKLRFIC